MIKKDPITDHAMVVCEKCNQRILHTNDGVVYWNRDGTPRHEHLYHGSTRYEYIDDFQDLEEHLLNLCGNSGFHISTKSRTAGEVYFDNPFGL